MMDSAAPVQTDTQPNAATDDRAALDALLEADIQDKTPDATAPEEEEQEDAPSELNSNTDTDTQDLSDPTADEEAVAPEDNQDTDGQPTEDGPQDATPVPARWDAKGKELFASATPELQAYLHQRETHLQGEHTRRQQELADVKLQLHQARTQPDQELASLIEAGRAQFGAKYEGVTEQVLLDAVMGGQITPEQAQAIKVEMTQEAAQLKQLEEAQSLREQAELKNHLTTRDLQLQKEAPDLWGNQERLGQIASFLAQSGYTAEQIRWSDATAIMIADDARQWRELQAKSQSAKPAAARQGKPTSGKPAQSGTHRAQQMTRLRRSNNPDDLRALLDMALEDEIKG